MESCIGAHHKQSFQLYLCTAREIEIPISGLSMGAGLETETVGGLIRLMHWCTDHQRGNETVESCIGAHAKQSFQLYLCTAREIEIPISGLSIGAGLETETVGELIMLMLGCTDHQLSNDTVESCVGAHAK